MRPDIRIVESYSPPYREWNEEDQEEFARRINEKSPDFVWVALGGEKQEAWIIDNLHRYRRGVFFAVGDAFELLAGRRPFAPEWCQRYGVTWLYRLLQEPSRMWRRYLKYNSLFLGYLLRDCLFSPAQNSVLPADENTSLPGSSSTKNSFKNPGRVNVLGVGVSVLNMDDATESLLTARRMDEKGYVCVTGVHGVIESQRDQKLRRIHNQSLFTVPDGMPTVWMGWEQGFARMGRVYGPDLMLRLCAATAVQKTEDSSRQSALMSGLRSPQSEGKCLTHFLYGATEEVLDKLKTNLERKFPGVEIVGTYAPPFRPLNQAEEEELRAIVAESKPDFFWVGLSTPKQESFMAQHDPRLSKLVSSGDAASGAALEDMNAKGLWPLDCGIMLGVGAAFDIHADLLKDAPEWIKNSGLQWFYRLCQEPRRLWRRYLDIVPNFLVLAALQLLGIRRYTIEDG
jgi:N-acetylglucosaminyldiphosphoundecaprenol N-acetyl-beta-D-mannosaminyltransferase